MTREEFIGMLDKKGYSYKGEGDKIIVNDKRDISFPFLTELPDNIEFRNGGYIDLRGVTTLLPGVVFNNKGSVGLSYVTTLYPGVVFRNEGDVSLRSLRAIPYDVVLSNNGDIDLRDLTMIPSRLRFNNTGNVLLKWKFDIEGIRSKEILNTMIKRKIII